MKHTRRETMIEYLDVDDKNVYVSTYRRKPSWIEVPKGTEVITGDGFDKYSLLKIVNNKRKRVT